MQNLILLSVLMIATLVSCRKDHSIKIIIQDSNRKVEKTFTVNSKDLFKIQLSKSGDERTKLLIENLCQADQIIFIVGRPIDLFSDGFVTYITEVYGYKKQGGKLVKHYNSWIASSCDKNTILSPKKMEFAQNLGGPTFGSEDVVNASILNSLIKDEITKKAAGYNVVETAKVVFVNAETKDSTDAKGFFKIVGNAAKAKKAKCN